MQKQREWAEESFIVCVYGCGCMQPSVREGAWRVSCVSVFIVFPVAAGSKNSITLHSTLSVASAVIPRLYMYVYLKWFLLSSVCTYKF